MNSYISPKIEVKQSTLGGRGLFTKEKLNSGEVVVDYTGGPGSFINLIEADKLYAKGSDYMIQVGEDSFFTATRSDELEDADFLNHSCCPNCGIVGSLKIVAMRDIKKGEEVVFDYAMSESSNYSMSCVCGSEKCRKKITGEDWKRPDLQKRYKGFFSKYISDWINSGGRY